MTANLAIFYGYGPIAEQVEALAAELACPPHEFIFEVPIADVALRNSRRAIERVNPFCFVRLEVLLRARKIKQVYFTGGFSSLVRLYNWYPSRVLPHELESISISDAIFHLFFGPTSGDLCWSHRFLKSLERLLADLHVQPLLAKQLFPDLTIDAIGHISCPRLPDSVCRDLPDLIRRIEENGTGTSALSRGAVVVDGIVEAADDGHGTDKMLGRFSLRQSERRRGFPLLVKLPAKEFAPALHQPVIGRNTIEKCHQAGVRGIVIRSDVTVVLEKEEVIRMCNDLGIALYALRATTGL